MKDTKPILIAVFIYLFVQGLALWISYGGYGIEKGVIEKIDTGEIQPVTQDPEDPYSAAYLFIMVMVATVFLLILLKYALNTLLKILIYSGFTVGLYYTFSSIIGEIPGLVTALIMMALFTLKKDDYLVINLVLLFVIPGIGSLLGASLSLIPALIFIVGLSIYDIIAVFGTKHMVKIAKEAKDRIPLMFAIPARDRYLGLGTGDMALPVVFTVSLLRDYPIGYSVLTALGGAIGMILLISYILDRKGLALPALPPITAGLLTGLAAALLIL